MNLDHLTWPTEGWGYMPCQEDSLAGFRYVQDNIRPNRVLEIGFHVGHSTTYMLEIMPQAKVDSIGVAEALFDIKRIARKRISDVYGDRVKVEIRNSDHVKTLFPNQYDFAFVDGGHSERRATLDIRNCIKMGIPYLLVDNCERADVCRACDKFDLDLKQFFLYTSEWKGKTSIVQQRLYHVRFDSI